MVKVALGNLSKELEKWFCGAERVVVAGIGNPMRMDDYIGVKIVKDLNGKVTDKVYLIECETVPESYMQQIIDFNPTHILIIDAAILNSKPGYSKLVFPEELPFSSAFSTHVLPLRLFCDYISKTVKAKIALLLIQPKNTDFGEGLTTEVAASAKKIVDLLVKILT
ncbi:MAG: hydrogenase 3 maturation endopeptidase HyCI [Candidatus Bathyarchaeia archaeon]